MIKLQPGDYVSTEGMTEEVYETVCAKFIQAGAKRIGSVCGLPVTNYVIWDMKDERLWTGGNLGLYKTSRELTIDQILGSDNTEGSKEINLQEAYKVMQANCGIEVGDTVKVLRPFKDKENGCGIRYNWRMDDLIGGHFVVRDISESYIDLSCGYLWPFFVLELVKKGKKLPEPLEISSDKHVVFCEGGEINLGIHHLNFELLEKIYMTAKEVKEQK